MAVLLHIKSCSNTDMRMAISRLCAKQPADLFGKDGVVLNAVEQEPYDGAHIAVGRKGELADEAMLSLRHVDGESLNR